jgi:hypothetical protein
MDIRLLRADEIDVRVQSVKKGRDKVGCILLLYKDARVDMNILDETFSPMGWQRDHKELKGNIYCGIGIFSQSVNDWIWKWDCGAESNTEKEKGEASDSFKRAGFNWGIGRELYTSPFIWVELKEGEYSESNGKTNLNANVKFSVKSIGYNENREINALEIVDNHHIVRYSLGRSIKPTDEPQKPAGGKKEDKQTNTSKPQNNASQGKYECEKCHAEISEKVKGYSESKYGIPLCMDCQKTVPQ